MMIIARYSPNDKKPLSYNFESGKPFSCDESTSDCNLCVTSVSQVMLKTYLHDPLFLAVNESLGVSSFIHRRDFALSSLVS